MRKIKRNSRKENESSEKRATADNLKNWEDRENKNGRKNDAGTNGKSENRKWKKNEMKTEMEK